MVVRLEKSPRKIIVAYQAEKAKLYFCALKEAQSGTEIWVDSFYRVKPGPFRNLPSKGLVLREHK